MPGNIMKHELETIIARHQIPADLRITYADRHGEQGASSITIQGDGRVEYQSTNAVSERELLALIALLIEVAAWEQAPERPPAADETSASLTISVGGRLSRVWEHFDALQANNRLMQIRTRMEQLSKQPSTIAAPAEAVPLLSPRQLPELSGETLILAWDQIDAESSICHGNTIVWRERTGWEVYERFEEIAVVLKHRYGDRLIDLVPTQRSLYALYGDSSRAHAHISSARQALAGELPTETFHWLGLAEAAGTGDAAAIRRYLTQGGDPDIRSVALNSADTLLHVAARRRQPDIARLLIIAGANVNALDSLEKPPLVAALDTATMPAAVRALAKWNYDPAALLPGPTTELVRLLLEAGAHPSGLNRPFSELQGLKREMYRPPLALAARYDYTDAVRVLLDHGAEVDSEDYLGDTPLIIAIRWGRAKPAQVLIAAGADVNRRPYSPDNDASTQLHMVIKSERFDPGHKLPLIERMIAAGADVNISNAVGDTPLLTAVRHGTGHYYAIIGVKKAHTYVSEITRWPVQHTLPVAGIAAIIHMLRSAGADVGAHDRDGKLARELAADAGLVELVALL
jgi:ankyrin repeat protein